MFNQLFSDSCLSELADFGLGNKLIIWNVEVQPIKMNKLIIIPLLNPLPHDPFAPINVMQQFFCFDSVILCIPLRKIRPGDSWHNMVYFVQDIL